MSETIRQSLRARILAFDLVPGQALSRVDLSRDYGVSQTPVRDAMIKLEHEGLLVVRPQSGTEVSRIDIAQARETQLLRLALEIEIGKRVAHEAAETGLAPLHDLLAQQEAALGSGSLTAFAELDRRFHRRLFELVDCEALWEMIAARSGHIDRLRHLDLPEAGKAAQILTDHRAIVDALARRDPQRIEAALRAHLSGTVARLEHIVALHPDYF